MVLTIQIIGVCFALFMIYLTILYNKRKEFSTTELYFWVVIWGLFGVVALVPHIVDPFVKKLNFARTFDFLVVLGFIFLTGLLFVSYAKTRKNELRLVELVRKIAMEREDK